LAHFQQQEFIKTIVLSINDSQPLTVVDFGSLDINGGVKQLIDPKWNYTGIDLEIGPNVDIARPGQLIDLQSEQFDISFSSELFEHTPFWKEIFAQMCRLTKPGGVVVFTCAGIGRKEHGTTRSDGGYSSPFTVKNGDEYYKNVARKDAEKSIAAKHWFSNYGFFDGYSTHDLYFVGIRKGSTLKGIHVEEDLIDKLHAMYPRKYWKPQSFGPLFFPQVLLEVYFQITSWFISVIRNLIYRIYVSLGLKSIFSK
jgi:SAM-dependent methyltransferase